LLLNPHNTANENVNRLPNADNLRRIQKIETPIQITIDHSARKERDNRIAQVPKDQAER